MPISHPGTVRRSIVRWIAALFLLAVGATQATEVLVPPAAKPCVYFRWLQMETKSADSLTAGITENRWSTDELTQRIDQAVAGGRMKEVASYQHEFVPEVPFQLPPGQEAESPDGLANSLPPTIHAEVSLGEDGVTPFRYVAERRFAAGKKSNGQTCINNISIPGPGWRVMQRWQDARDVSLLLARIVNVPLPPPNPDRFHWNPVTLVHLDAEWRETARANLPQLGKATPDNSRKARDWFRQRSSLLGAASGSGGQNGPTFHQHLLANDQNDLDERKKPGFELEWQPELKHDEKPPGFTASTTRAEIIAAVDKILSNRTLRMNLTSHYRSPKVRSDAGLSEFKLVKEPMALDVPRFVLPEVLPEGAAPAVVLVITPHLEIIRRPTTQPLRP